MANGEPPPTLEGLAKKWCTERNLAAPDTHETDLLKNVQTGKPTTLSATAIRGELIRFLCGDADAQEFVDPCGIVITGPLITGETVSNYPDPALLLSSLKIPFPLILHNCTLPAWLLLQGAEIPFLDLDGCEVNSIAADVLKIRGDLHMRNGFRSNGNLNFSGAAIGGDLDLSGAELKLPTKKPLDPRRRNASLSAEGIHVSGDIRMTDYWDQAKKAAAKSATVSDSSAATPSAPNPNANPDPEILHFKSTGTINLDGAHIDGDITCDGGKFGDDNAPDAELHDALTLRHATIGGDVLLGRGFVSKGAVRLPGATIGGDMDCGRGYFFNPWIEAKTLSGVALELDGTEIKLDLSLSYGRDRVPVANTNVDITANANGKDAFKSHGTVSLRGTRVGRTLHCATGYFLNTDPPKSNDKHHRWRPALDLENARVAFLHYSFRPDDVKNPHLKKGQLLLDGFVYDRISQGTKKWNECLEWIDKQYSRKSTDFSSQPYLQLAKVLREEGDTKSAKKILYKMEDRRTLFLWRAHTRLEQPNISRDANNQPQPAPGVSKASSLFSPFMWMWIYLRETWSIGWRFVKRITIGYGYFTHWALVWLAAICLLGAMIFHCGNAYMAPTDRTAYNITETPPGGPLPGNYVVFNPFLYSVENTLPIIKLGQTDHWEPFPHPLPPFPKTCGDVFRWLRVELSPPGILGVLRAFQIAAGWFLTTIGVAGLTGIIRKD